MPRRVPLLTILSYAVIYLVWSSTYLAIKYAVATIEPYYIVGMRFFIAGVVLLAGVSLVSRAPLPDKSAVFNAVIIGVLLFAGGNGLVVLAQKQVDSYVAALIISSTPIFVAVWDWLLFRRRLALSSIGGILVGIIGVALLLKGKPSGGQGSAFYTGVLIAAIGCWSLGTSLTKKLRLPANPIMTSAIQQAIVGAGVLAIMVAVQPSFFTRLHAITLVSWLAFAYLVVFATLAVLSYTYLLTVEPNERVVTYAFVNPLLATVLGMTVGGEVAVPNLMPAIACILAGLFLVFFGRRVLRF